MSRSWIAFGERVWDIELPQGAGARDEIFTAASKSPKKVLAESGVRSELRLEEREEDGREPGRQGGCEEASHAVLSEPLASFFSAPPSGAAREHGECGVYVPAVSRRRVSQSGELSEPKSRA